MPGRLKQVLLGDPLHNKESAHQRLSNPVALAVFSSDALSSVAYATEEILLVLVLAGTAALELALPIAAGIGLLLLVVATSYRQTIKAYPSGGGAYIVAKENLGTYPGLVAGASLLVDYTLTVAVSISAGTSAITSAFPTLMPYRVEIAVALTVLLALANLRGVRESGALFAGPTYLFIIMLGALVITGLVKVALGMTIEVPAHGYESAAGTLTLFLLLRAFASGCTAMTGVEAIANGVQAFRQPEARNARTTLSWMAGILLFLFVGTTALAQFSGVQPSHTETVISQLARGVFGSGVLYFLLQVATAAILVIAANTSYADFPRLASFMASDGFLPKQLRERGRRLVHSNGILLLTAVAILLLIVFRGDTHRLIPLYAIGVFTSFTLSQSGMVVHWLRSRDEGWRSSIAVNGLGALTTAVVLVVIAIAKFSQGAWIVLLVVPVLVAYFAWVKRHYTKVELRLRIAKGDPDVLDPATHEDLHNHVVILVGAFDRRLVRAIQYARTLRADSMEAIYVDITGTQGEKMRRKWAEYRIEIPLTVIDSPYREIIDPILRHIRRIPRPDRDHAITVIIPEFVPEDRVDFLLHDQTAFWIKQALFVEPGVIAVDVPYHLSSDLARNTE
ncbi:MAG: APC family permease [Coriobacteriales bacterium]|nr:APC family permease [Actinomycetes bacterium]